MNNIINIDAFIRSTWVYCPKSDPLRALTERGSVEPLCDIFGRSSGLCSVVDLAKAYNWWAILSIGVESAEGHLRSNSTVILTAAFQTEVALNSGHRMAVEGMQLSWRWTSGTISTNLDVIWGTSA